MVHVLKWGKYLISNPAISQSYGNESIIHWQSSVLSLKHHWPCQPIDKAEVWHHQSPVVTWCKTAWFCSYLYKAKCPSIRCRQQRQREKTLMWKQLYNILMMCASNELNNCQSWLSDWVFGVARMVFVQCVCLCPTVQQCGSVMCAYGTEVRSRLWNEWCLRDAVILPL